ncbi:hypothetical protein [Streptomyces chartreusis]|uniref:hypothetical protein n=1 Tax=Streptomyces chartreusis TaxID=1969 RepID=UPI002E17A338
MRLSNCKFLVLEVVKMTDMLLFAKGYAEYCIVEDADSLISPTSLPDKLKIGKPKKLSSESVKGRMHAFDTHLGKVYYPRVQGGIVECDLASGASQNFCTETQFGCVAYEPETKVLYAGLVGGGHVYSFHAAGASRVKSTPVDHIITDASAGNAPEGEFYAMVAKHDIPANTTYLYLTQGKSDSRLIVHIVDPSKQGGGGFDDDFFSRGHGVCRLNLFEPNNIQVSPNGDFLVVGSNGGFEGNKLVCVRLASTPPESHTIQNPIYNSVGTEFDLEVMLNGWAVVGKSVYAQVVTKENPPRFFLMTESEDYSKPKIVDARTQLNTKGTVGGGGVSPDGKWMYFHSIERMFAFNPATKELRQGIFDKLMPLGDWWSYSWR